MSKYLEYYIAQLPEECRINLSLLEEFKGNRTLCLLKFNCGCETKQLLKSILKLKDLRYCYRCKDIYAEKYTCKYCQTEFINKNWYENCINSCQNKYKDLQENKDFVICQICGYHAKSLGYHLNKNHQIKPKEYKKKFPAFLIITPEAVSNYSHASISSGSWLQKAIAEGDDLSEYRKKMSESVSSSILNNAEEIARRSKLMGEINKTDIMRQRASETAKKTSSRVDILERRSKQLEKWRNESPEEFHEKCITKLVNAFQSKPEGVLFDFVCGLKNFSFKRNQFINSKFINNKSHNKQIDIVDKEKRIYIEYDGPIHFENYFGNLEKIQKRDKELEQHINYHGWTLIRISYDRFIYKTKSVDKNKIDSSYFKQECLDQIVEILNSKKPGIYKIGEVYGER